MPRIPLLALILVARAGSAQSAPCTAQELKNIVVTISADSAMGRSPGSQGDRLATAYLTKALARAVGVTGAVKTQTVPVGSEGKSSQNIIATIPGQRDEWIVLMAHHDGLGVGKPDVRGDSIYNGANDNAVGVAIAMCVARRLSPAVGRRGVVVILTAAEESGRVGSRYWSEHPTVDVRKVKFAVNVDAIGIAGPTRDFIAYGNGMLIGADSMLRSAGASANFELSTASFEANMYWAFDHAELAAIGVPAITIGQGMRAPVGALPVTAVGMPPVRQRYHSPSDQVADDWDFDAIVRYADLIVSVVEAARTHDGVIDLRSPNAYQKRP